MELIFAFGLAMLAAVLVSELAGRSMFSLPLMFLAAGVLAGPTGFGLLSLGQDAGLVQTFAQVALFAVLFTDGIHVTGEVIRSYWKPPFRALLLGFPLTVISITGIAWSLTDLGLLAALLLAFVLAPTDPVMVSALIRRKYVPSGLQHTLNIESGVNDALALPGVTILVAVTAPALSPASQGQHVLVELAGGILLGAAGPLVLALLLRLPILGTHEHHQPLGPVALAIVLYATASLLHVNLYLTAFTAGVVMVKMLPVMADDFNQLGNQLSELIKSGALLVFGALLTPALLFGSPISYYAVALLTLVLARPGSLLLSLLGTKLSRKERLAVAWFGPRGLASVVFALYVLQSDAPFSREVFEIAAICVVLSMIVHTTSDVPIAKRLESKEVVENGSQDDLRSPSA